MEDQEQQIGRFSYSQYAQSYQNSTLQSSRIEKFRIGLGHILYPEFPILLD